MTGDSLNQGEIDELLSRLNSKRDNSSRILPEEKRGNEQRPAALVERLEFAPLKVSRPRERRQHIAPYEGIPLKLNLELGRTSITVRQLLDLEEGTVLKLDKMAGETVNLLVNGHPVARGEVVVINDHFGIRITSVSEHKNDEDAEDKGS